MTSFSVYPNDIDGYSTLPLRRDGVHEIRADDHNRLRDAIVKIEQELGIQPSGVFATVKDRLDSIGDASTLIEAHLVDPIDAHDASAISILDTADNYISTDVEGALGELAAALPTASDTIGNDNTSVPNSGLPSFVDSDGPLHVFNTGAGANILKKTQPVNITGVHVIEVGESNGEGISAQLRFTTGPSSLEWKAPGDSFGTAVDISGLNEGDIIKVSSSDTTKSIRVARSSASLPSTTQTDTFDLIKFNQKSGTFSATGTGFIATSYITRAAGGDSETTQNQFMIKGVIYPADKGTLVLQRKLRLSTDSFTAIAVLDLGDNFDEDLRTTSQPVYVPELPDSAGFDIITLFDRLPVRKDYETLTTDSDGNAVYTNFSVSATFSSFQVAKYLIPISNMTTGISGELESPTDISASEINNKVSAYRIVHYKLGITDFNGTPDEDDIFSLVDAVGDVNDTDNNVRMANVYSDSNATRPSIEQMVLRPTIDAEVSEKTISGIHYYNGEDDLFDIELKTSTDIFANTYLRESILRFRTDAFEFPSGVSAGNFGTEVDVDELFDDGYSLFSASNLPTFSDQAFYLINGTFNTGRRIFPEANKFSLDAHISATVHDPFGPGATYDAYGYITSSELPVRLLVNSFSVNKAIATEEYFVDESKRVGPFRELGVEEDFLVALDRGQFNHTFGVNSNGYTLAPWHNDVPLDSALDSNTILTTSSLQCGGKFGSASNSPDDSADYTLSGLIYPQNNYDATGIRPTQGGSGSVDYSAFTGNRFYQRVFTLGKTVHGGKLRIVSSGSSLISFNDIYVSNANRFCKIEVKIPGVGPSSTEWLDVGKFFETGKFEDGDGALTSPITGVEGDFTVSFTFQDRNTADSGDMIAVRVTYLGAQITTAKKKILSLLQLLE